MSTVDVEILIRPKGRGKPRQDARVAHAAAAPRIPRITRLMALAIKFHDMVDRGEVCDYADLARLGYVSRARITQIMNLLQLAPDIQEHLLCEVTSRPTAERYIRRMASIVEWSEQRLSWNAERS
jgi:hypothetical protein